MIGHLGGSTNSIVSPPLSHKYHQYAQEEIRVFLGEKRVLSSRENTHTHIILVVALAVAERREQRQTRHNRMPSHARVTDATRSSRHM